MWSMLLISTVLGSVLVLQLSINMTIPIITHLIIYDYAVSIPDVLLISKLKQTQFFVHDVTPRSLRCDCTVLYDPVREEPLCRA